MAIGALLASFSPTSLGVVAMTQPEPVQITLEEHISLKAEEYGVSAIIMKKVINCENPDLDTTLQSRIIAPDGRREDSWGLVQIHLPSHPSVNKTQATNPEFAIDFLASKLSEGKGELWACYRKLAAL